MRGESRYARWTTPDPLADKYHSTSPYAFCNNNPVNFMDPDGRRWYDKAVGYSVGTLTNIIPGTGVAAGTAVAMVGAGATVVSGGTAAVAGVPVAAIGVETAILGAKTATAGVILMANSAQNKSGGYERGIHLLVINLRKSLLHKEIPLISIKSQLKYLTVTKRLKTDRIEGLFLQMGKTSYHPIAMAIKEESGKWQKLKKDY